MIRDYGAIRQSAGMIGEAIDAVVAAYSDGRIEQETDFTSRMLASIERSVNGQVVKGIRWTSKVLTDKGPGAQEKQYGADFVGVLEIILPTFILRKGFLAQSKRIEPSASLGKADYGRLLRQSEQMLRLSPSSFVFLYSLEGVFVVPAISIVSTHIESPLNPHTFYSRSVSRFYEEHFSSFIGDRDISSPTIETLTRLGARYLLSIEGRPAEA